MSLSLGIRSLGILSPSLLLSLSISVTEKECENKSNQFKNSSGLSGSLENALK